MGSATGTSYDLTIGPSGSTVGNHLVVNGGGFNTTCQTSGTTAGTVVVNSTTLSATCVVQIASGVADNDVRGSLIATTTAAPAAGPAVVATVYFKTAFTTQPLCLIATNGEAAASGSVSGQVVTLAGYYVSSTSTTSFVVTASGKPKASSAGGGFNWQCFG